MLESFQALQAWAHWLAQPEGQRLIRTEQYFIAPILANLYGKNNLLIGAAPQSVLLEASRSTLLNPLSLQKNLVKTIQASVMELPILTATIDLVILPHTLELVEYPHEVLAEACRVAKLDGHIVILGFNPHSLWGFKKFCSNTNKLPWSSNCISPRSLQNWLTNNFAIKIQQTFLFRLPYDNMLAYEALPLCEWLGKKFFAPWGTLYVVLASADNGVLTPVKNVGFRTSLNLC